MQSIVNVGGTVNMGVITFDDFANLTFAMTPFTPTFQNNLIYYINNVYLTRGGATNWADALNLAARNWGVTVDIFVWFTDGQPEVATGPWVCADGCYNETSSAGKTFFSDICAGSAACVNNTNGALTFNSQTGLQKANLWAACTAADFLKQSGSKIFVVGVGDVQRNEDEIQVVTGLTHWDGQSSTFSQADYIINSNYSQLTTLFQQVGASLCPCFVSYPACDALEQSCNARFFSARVQVTTTSTSVSTVFPISSTVAAYLYYNFLGGASAQVSYDFFAAGQSFATPSPSVGSRTDILNPCKLERLVTCGSGCFNIQEKQNLPRFFLEATDTAGTAGSRLYSNSTIAGCSGFTKVYPYPTFPYNYGVASPEVIRFIWTLNTDGITPCAAEAFDGTMYEFFKDTSTRGVVGVGNSPISFTTGNAVSFVPNGTCTVLNCTSPVEMVFVIDEQAGIGSSDFSNIQQFILTLMNSANNNSRFGWIWSQSGFDSPPAPNLLLQQSGVPGGDLKSYIVTGHPLPRGGTSDFASLVTQAATTFFPGATSPSLYPRQIVTIVGGPNTYLGGNFTAMQLLLASKNIEYWSVGVNVGSQNVTLLGLLGSTNQYAHYESHVSSSDLVTGTTAADLSLRLCPAGSLCGAGCKGFCRCAGAGSCECPTCAQDNCTSTRTCASPQSGCFGTSKNCDDNNACTTDTCDLIKGCQNTLSVFCDDGNACTTDTCVNGACNYQFKTCTGADPCYQNNLCDSVSGNCQTTVPIDPSTYNSTNNACSFYTCVVGHGGPALQRTTCNDSNECTIDGCVNSTGCFYTNRTCADTNACTADLCNSTLPGGCYFPDKSTNCAVNDRCQVGLCSSTSGCYNVSNATNCIGTDACMVYGCDSVAGCTAVPRVCFDGDYCKNWTCSSSSGCSYKNITCDDGNQCTTDSCSVTSGCVYSPVLCDDDNACTSDTCSPGGGCAYSPVTCNDNNVCTSDSCSTVSGCVYTSQPAAFCDDSNACSVDSCVDGSGCAHDFSANTTCAARSDACFTYACNATSGGCDLVYTNTCIDNDICTDDVCNVTANPTSGCVNTAKSASAVTSLCRPGSCQSAACVSNACSYTNITTGICAADPCVTSPCATVATYCATPVCINVQTAPSGYSCASISNSTAQSACNANITAGGRYCYSFPTNVCAASDACTTRTCNPAGQGSCDSVAVACTTSDVCLDPICVLSGSTPGCTTQPKSAAFCNDGNPCTSDTCVGPTTGCVYATINGCSLCASACTVLTPNACQRKNCAETAGQCATSDNAPACNSAVAAPGGTYCWLSAITCSDNNACTIDSCDAAAGCVYSPTTCDDANACTTDSCSAATGCAYTPFVCVQPSLCSVYTCIGSDGLGQPNCTATSSVVCDDGSSCTVDSCQEGVGCVYQNISCTTSTIAAPTTTTTTAAPTTTGTTAGSTAAATTTGTTAGTTAAATTTGTTAGTTAAPTTTSTTAALTTTGTTAGTTAAPTTTSTTAAPTTTGTTAGSTASPTTTSTTAAPTTTGTTAGSTASPTTTSTTAAPTTTGTTAGSTASPTTTGTTAGSTASPTTTSTTAAPTTTSTTMGASATSTTTAAPATTAALTTSATPVSSTTAHPTSPPVFLLSISGSAQVFNGGDSVGDPVKFTFVIENSGTVDASGLVLTLLLVSPGVQANLGLIQCSGGLVGSSATSSVPLLGTLAVGAQITCVATYSLADASSTVTSIVARVVSTSAPSVSVTVSAARPVCAEECTCGCSNEDVFDVSTGKCAKVCKDKQHCCWLSSDNSCSDRPPLCDSHPEQLYDTADCLAMASNVRGNQEVVGDNYCDWNSKCHSENDPSTCTVQCPLPVIQGCSCNSTSGTSCTVTSSAVDLPANSAVAVPVCNLSGGNNWTVPVTSSLSCGTTIVDSVTAFQVCIGTNAGSTLNLGRVVSSNGTISVNCLSRPGGSSRKRATQSVQIMSYDSIEGSFNVKIVPAYDGSSCDTLQSSVTQSTTTLSATIAVDTISPAPYGCPGGPVFSTWQIVLLCCGLMLVLTIGIVAFILLLQRRRRNSAFAIRDLAARSAMVEMERTASRASEAEDHGDGPRLGGRVRVVNATTGQVLIDDNVAGSLSVDYDNSVRAGSLSPDEVRTEYLASRIPASSPRTD